MKRGLLIFAVSFLILAVLSARYFFCLSVFLTGDRLLLPVWVEKIDDGAYPFVAYLRYYNFIPVNELEHEKGKIVIKRFEDGRIDFVSNAEEERHSRELMLTYEIIPPSLFDPEQKEPNIRFASTVLRFSNKKTFSPAAVRYAVVYVNSQGRSLLAGLADGSGTMLVKELSLEAFRIR